MVALSPIAYTSVSGMKAARTRLEVSAVNIANLGSEDYRRHEVSATAQPDGGVSTSVGMSAQPGPALVDDVVAQLAAKNQFLANLAVFRASMHRSGSLLDIAA